MKIVDVEVAHNILHRAPRGPSLLTPHASSPTGSEPPPPPPPPSHQQMRGGPPMGAGVGPPHGDHFQGPSHADRFQGPRPSHSGQPGRGDERGRSGGGPPPDFRGRVSLYYIFFLLIVRDEIYL